MMLTAKLVKVAGTCNNSKHDALFATQGNRKSHELICEQHTGMQIKAILI